MEYDSCVIKLTSLKLEIFILGIYAKKRIVDGYFLSSSSVIFFVQRWSILQRITIYPIIFTFSPFWKGGP